MPVLEIENKSQLQQQLLSAGDNLIIVECYSPREDQCKMISQRFLEMSNQYSTQWDFIRINVDECGDISEVKEVSSLPTFLIYKNSEKLGQVSGPHLDILIRTLKEIDVMAMKDYNPIVLTDDVL